MITIIRISGQVNLNEDVAETMYRMRIRRKYACAIIDETAENLGMLKKVRNFVAYGKTDKAVLIELIEKRGQVIDKKAKIDAEKTADMILKNKNFDGTNIKPFFRLHPPRKGINSRQHFPKGVLGDNKEKINNLLRRML